MSTKALDRIDDLTESLAALRHRVEQIERDNARLRERVRQLERDMCGTGRCA